MDSPDDLDDREDYTNQPERAFTAPLPAGNYVVR
jgi:hypothetical protein